MLPRTNKCINHFFKNAYWVNKTSQYWDKEETSLKKRKIQNSHGGVSNKVLIL